MGKQAISGVARGQHFFVDPNRVTIIGRDTDHGPGEHPLWDERALRPVDPARVKNIRAYGVRVAVVCRKNGKDESGEDILEVIDGRGRTIDCREAFRLAEEAGEVGPLLKVELDRSEEDSQIGVMVSLNEHRHDDTPMIKARKAGRIIAAGRDIKDVANMFNVSTVAVRQWLNLLELAKPVQKAVDDGKISASAALPLRKFSRGEQKEQLTKLLESAPKGKKPTVRQTREKVDGKAPRLTSSLAKKLLDDEEWLTGVSEDAAHVLAWVAGVEPERAVKRVPGLTKLLKQLAK